MSAFLEGLPADFETVDFSDLPGFSSDRQIDAWGAFIASCTRLSSDGAVLRSGAPSPPGLPALASLALRVRNPSERDIRDYFSGNFSAYKIKPHAGKNPYPHGFVTGYYEPEVPASLVKSPGFQEPARGRPSDLLSDTIRFGETTFIGARKGEDGGLQPYWSRAEIDAGMSKAPPILWLKDAIELFMIQVQGSAKAVLPDGTAVRLVYDGRNGHPYESIGRILVSEGHIPLADMSLDSLKKWVRDAGQELGAPGRTLLHRNPSYVFFRVAQDSDPARGPIGGEGVPLTKFRSLAVDRAIWPYGLPFWVSGRLPSEAGDSADFQRLLIAQDTGSAIIGAARGDIFYGSGDLAGQAAARVRHEVEMFVMLPKT